MTTHAVRPAPPSPTPQVGDLRVDRVAGLSADDLTLALTDAVLAEAELAACEKQTDELADLVSDILFRLVPLLDDDPAARRRVLAVRRASRPGKTPRPADLEVTMAAARDRLGAGDCELLDLWAGAVTSRQAARARYQEAYDADLRRAGQALTRVAGDPALARGVAHASTSLGVCLDSVDTTPHRVGSRGLVSYATRAAYKTSPFSDLTTVTDNTETSGRRREQLYVAPGVVHEWFIAMTRDRDLVRAFQVEPLDLAGCDAHEQPVLVPETVHTEQFTWVQDQRVDLSGYADLLDRLRWLGRRPAADYLEAIGGTDPFATLMRLAAVNVVRFVTPWGYGQTDRLGALIDALATVDTPRAAEVTAELRDLGEALARIAAAGGPERAALLDGLPRPGLPGTPAPAVFSDVTGGPAVPAAMPAAEAELTRVLAGARPLIFRSFIYAALVQDFAATFGPGGRCDDVAGYLSALAAKPVMHQAMFADVSAPAEQVQAQRFAPVGRSSAAPSCAVMYQVSAATREQAVHGDGTIVVNQVNPGLGGLVARFGSGQEPSPLRNRLREWISRLYPEATPLEFVTASDVNDMQAVSEGTLPRLVWPTATPRAHDHPDAVPLARLHLRHEPVTDTLELRTPDGRPVAPVYLGLVPAHLLGGATRLLAVLGDPWVNRLGTLTRPPRGLDTAQDAVLHLPRVQRGRVVLRRQSWVFPAGQVPTRDPQQPDADHFRRLRCFRQEAGLPENVFVRVDTGRPGSTAAKPMWTSFASPHAWAPVAERLKGARRVTFTEQLPGPEGYWLTDDEGRTRAAEHISFLTWPAADSAHPEGLT